MTISSSIRTFRTTRASGETGAPSSSVMARSMRLLRSACVVDFVALAGDDLDPKRHIGSKHLAPGEFPRPLVELRQMQRPEIADPRQNARRTAQGQVGAPDVFPSAFKRHATADGDRRRESGLFGLSEKIGFKSRLGAEENFKGF